MLAGVAGVICSVLGTWQSRVLVSVVAVVLFGGVLGQGNGPSPWPYTPLFVLSLVLGAGYRTLARSEQC